MKIVGYNVYHIIFSFYEKKGKRTISINAAISKLLLKKKQYQESRYIS